MHGGIDHHLIIDEHQSSLSASSGYDLISLAYLKQIEYLDHSHPLET
jgi:hypothetical protein